MFIVIFDLFDHFCVTAPLLLIFVALLILICSSSRRYSRMGHGNRDLNSSMHSRISMRGGDISDDDSFQSANEYMTDEEANRRVQEVQYNLKQRESMRTKLMTELRFNEGSSHTLYKALEEELHACDREISHLQVAYVEALMNLTAPPVHHK